VPFLEHHVESTGKVGSVGFCWGGGMLNRVPVHSADLKAVVAYYGEQPPADVVKSIHAALLLLAPVSRPTRLPSRRRTQPLRQSGGATGMGPHHCVSQGQSKLTAAGAAALQAVAHHALI